eukprot:1015048-Rhodomonas_salina.2
MHPALAAGVYFPSSIRAERGALVSLMIAPALPSRALFPDVAIAIGLKASQRRVQLETDSDPAVLRPDQASLHSRRLRDQVSPPCADACLCSQGRADVGLVTPNPPAYPQARSPKP